MPVYEAGLADLREELNFSQKQLAKALGISQSAVAKIEQKDNDPRLSTLKRYVEAMSGSLSLAVKMPDGHSSIFQI
ncbi:helix-turn-helix domain-containing protein [[Haemophilus] felis]|uniref:Transcriptional regulator n=1 Tax=[Haemophilus] felis TaxID=123822 RepID=A0A1T0B0I4_9PAST|nr:helix-turn-helix domain-containing protein [[Haemophilus] felis]NBI40680.1 helix-turn-helix domain-containing protein [[Haemophilus] felis]OOS03241.1 transcriptional regulator [[Haemophilus] felis]